MHCKSLWIKACAKCINVNVVYVKRVKQCTHALRACSFTAWFSRLKYIKNDRKIQDMGQKMYVFTFHIGKITFFLHK